MQITKNKIAVKVKFGRNYSLGQNVIIKEGVAFGDKIEIGNNVIIYEGSHFGDNVKILDNVVIGKQPTAPFGEHGAFKISYMPPITFGDNITIGTASICYAGSKIGDYFFAADRIIIREAVEIGHHISVGKDSIVEHHVRIGDYTKIQSKALIGEGMVVGRHVFIGPYFNGTCDKYMNRFEEKVFEPPRIEDYARIGAHVVLMAGITVGQDSVVGAGAVVTKDVPDYSVVVGIPSRVLKKIPPEQRFKRRFRTP